MIHPDPPLSVRTVLRAHLLAAMKGRDREAVQTYRVALAAIDNAEAVPLTDRDRAGAIEDSAVGVGAAEAARQTLSEDEITAVIRAEAAERRETARLLLAGDSERAAALDREAERLEELIRRR